MLNVLLPETTSVDQTEGRKKEKKDPKTNGKKDTSLRERTKEEGKKVRKKKDQKRGGRTGMERGELKPSVKRHCSLATLLGGSGRVVNSLDFCPASLKSRGCFYFWCAYFLHNGRRCP